MDEPKDREDETADDEPAGRSTPTEGFDLEPEEPVEPVGPVEDAAERPADPPGASSPVDDLDTCPSCGAPLRGHDTVVCLRCGFDLRSLKPLETQREEPASETDADGVADAPPLVREGMGGLMLPAIVGAIAALASIIGYLSGAPGLYPRTGADAGAAAAAAAAATQSGPGRLEAMARYPALIVFWSACGLLGLGAVTWLRGRSFGDLTLAAVRMLAIVAMAQLLAFIALPWPIVEFPTEAIGQAAVFVCATMLLFRMGWRDALMVLGVTICAYFTLYVTAHLLAWAL